MRASTLTALAQAATDKTALVLAVDLATGDEDLFDAARLDAESSPRAEAARQALADDRSQTVTLDGREVFFNVFNPPLELLIVGAVHIAQALAPMARIAGYAVTIIDPREAFAADERFPGVRLLAEWPDTALTARRVGPRTAIVTLTHDPKLDDAALLPALRSQAFYIGALGSRKTQLARRNRLARAGLSEAEIDRLNGPVGLAIGAKSPAEIAISILAQMTAFLRGGQVR